ncbi:hypothetical protein HID58_071386 [Brassica napus]|uniref:Uncharacterized protein n=1 Tax=Brassica napus TaxID=3708 RepID=A0ABQ7Z1H4_BRANA|nr:hypothetical protein HID58_071386 [Brassica napus]
MQALPHYLYAYARYVHFGDLKMFDCGQTMHICFGYRQSSEDGELLVVDRDNQEDNALFYVRCIAPKVQGIRNFSFKLNVLSTTTLSCTRPLFNRVHSVSKLGCFPCSQEHGLCNQQILLCINRHVRFFDAAAKMSV